MNDELTTIRRQRDELLFRLGQYFQAEQAQDKKGQQLALGHLLVEMSNIERSPHPYTAENREAVT